MCSSVLSFAYEASRPVDLPAILKHELLPVPISLAEMNGMLRTGNKSILAEKLTKDIVCPEAIDLSEELIIQAPDGKEIVVGGGFREEHEVRSSRSTTDLSQLKATHEEADTRMVLHAVHSQHNTVVVSSKDTDVLVLLLSHFQHIHCEHLWMLTGTAKKPRYIQIGAVFNNLPTDSATNLLPFHALTGCDTTSYFANHTKKSAWKTFIEHHGLLSNLGIGTLTETTTRSVEKFVCRMYDVLSADSVDAARLVLFCKAGKPEAMSPTSDALKFHLMRVHYQTMVWRYALNATPELPSPVSMGWKRLDSGLQPILIRVVVEAGTSETKTETETWVAETKTETEAI